MRKVWIEAALNGAWSRALQPGIPDTVEAIVNESIACAPAISASVRKMHRSAHQRPTSLWSRKRCGWSATMAPSPLRPPDAAGAGPIGLNLPGQSRGAKICAGRKPA
jgi:hypothetical protein